MEAYYGFAEAREFAECRQVNALFAALLYISIFDGIVIR
jgi:hypothetical protein